MGKLKQRTKTSVGIMVDVDSILDTRKGTIKKLYPEIFEEIKNSPKYHLRKEDRWDLIDERLDHNLITLNYQGRNIETIKNSQLTMVSRMVLELINSLLLDVNGNHPEVASFYFIVNFYPYRVPEDIKIELCRLLGHQLGILSVPIGVVDKPWTELNPSFLKDNNIRYWYCYHYEEWLQYNYEPVGTEEINKDSIVGFPECKIFSPKLSQNQKGLEAFLDSIHDCPYSDQYELTKSIFSSIANFEFTPVASFCQLDADKLRKLEMEKNMERSEVLSTPEMVTNELMKRLGEKPHISKVNAEHYLNELEQLIYDLKIFNTKESFSLFKTQLAKLNLTVPKLYNSVPFNSGEDLEQLLDNLSLSVDTSIEDYEKTEAYWNEKKVATIQVQEELTGGEIIYRCVSSEDYPELEIKSGQLLKPVSANRRLVKPADDINFLGYFGDGQ